MKRSRGSRFAARERGLRRIRTVTALTAAGGVALATAFGVSLAIPSAAPTTPTSGHDNGSGYDDPGLSTDPHSPPQPQQQQPQLLDGGGGVPHALSGGS